MANVRDFVEHDKPRELIETAESVGRTLATERLTTSQIRNIFGMVRQIKMSWLNDEQGSYRQAVLLKPKIAYQTERVKEKDKQRGRGMEALKDALDDALDAVIAAPQAERRIRFERVTDFLEAIVAYHKRHGGRER
jgi:CRISPR-associated protein Csm2